jgi:hypothetical protein
VVGRKIGRVIRIELPIASFWCEIVLADRAASEIGFVILRGGPLDGKKLLAICFSLPIVLHISPPI